MLSRKLRNGKQTDTDVNSRKIIYVHVHHRLSSIAVSYVDPRTLHSKKKVKVCFCIAQYPVGWTVQSALHLLPPPPLADLSIPTPTRLLQEAF